MTERSQIGGLNGLTYGEFGDRVENTPAGNRSLTVAALKRIGAATVRERLGRRGEDTAFAGPGFSHAFAGRGPRTSRQRNSATGVFWVYRGSERRNVVPSLRIAGRDTTGGTLGEFGDVAGGRAFGLIAVRVGRPMV